MLYVKDIVIRVFNEIKEDRLTNTEYLYILSVIGRYRSKEHIDNYMQRIKNGEESLEDFLYKLEHLR